MIDKDFKPCIMCNKYPNIEQNEGSWDLNCSCGIAIPGCKSKEQLLRGWNKVLERNAALKESGGRV